MIRYNSFLLKSFVILSAFLLVSLADTKSAMADSKTVFITNFTDLYGMGVQGNNEQAQEYWIKTATQIAGQGLEENNFYFYFDQEFPENEELFLYSREEGLFLKEIMKVNKVGAHCSSTTKINTEEIAKGGSNQTHISGICGQLATIHSLLKLKKWDAKKISDGKSIKSDKIDEISKHQKKFKSGMTMSEILKAHEANGANQCRGMTREINVVKDVKLFKGANRALAKMLKEKPVWDCSLSLSAYNKDKKLTFSHVEHIIGIDAYDEASGGLNLKTIDGLKQGTKSKGKHKGVPIKPGTNTWGMAPGSRFPIVLDDSDDDNTYDKFSKFVATHMQFVCCRPKP